MNLSLSYTPTTISFLFQKPQAPNQTSSQQFLYVHGGSSVCVR